MKLYIGGRIGHTPSVVTQSLELALLETAADYKVDPNDESFDEQWTCAFIDGEPSMLRCTVTIETPGDEQRTVTLYVESFDLTDETTARVRV